MLLATPLAVPGLCAALCGLRTAVCGLRWAMYCMPLAARVHLRVPGIDSGTYIVAVHAWHRSHARAVA